MDLEFKCNADFPPLLPSKNYEVMFVDASKRWLWRRQVIFLRFKVTEFCEYQGQELFMACTEAPNGKWTIGYKFYNAWILAYGTRPKRKCHMSTDVFRNKIFLAKVGPVKKNSKGTARQPDQQYSVIQDLIKRIQ